MQLHLDIAFWDDDGENVRQFNFESQIPDGYDKIFDAWLSINRIPNELWENSYSDILDSLMGRFYSIVINVVESRLGFTTQDYENGKYEINDPFVDEHGVMYAAIDVHVRRKKIKYK